MQTLDQYERQLEGYRAAGDAPLPPCPLVSDAFNPHPPHKVGIAHLLLKPRFGLFDPTGVGKTPMSLVAFSYLHWKQGFKAIIVARQKAILQWQAQVEKFLPGLRTEVLGEPKERAESYRRFLAGETSVLIGTRHGIIKDWTEPVHANRDKKRGRKWQFDPKALGDYCLILDEIHNIRGHTGGFLHPGAKLLSESARYVWGLTATPLFDSLEDVYAVFDLIRPGMLGPYETFERTFFNRFQMSIPIKGSKSRAKRKIWKNGYPKKELLPHLMKLVEPFYLQRGPDVFDAYLPEVRTKTWVVDLEPAQQQLYDRIIASKFPKGYDHVDTRSAQSITSSHLRAEKRRQVDPSNPVEMEKIASLLYAQLAVDAPEVLGINCKSAKLEALKEFLTEEDPRSQVVVYTRFEQVATVLVRHLREQKIKTVRITGTESAEKARTAQLDFQSGAARVVVITSAGGESIDLQAGRVLVFYDLPWAFGEFQQVVGRVRRVGSPHGSVLLLLLGTTHTIDSKTLAILQRKEKLVAATFTLKDLLLAGEDFESPTVIHAPVPDTVLRSASITADAFVTDLFDLMQADVDAA